MPPRMNVHLIDGTYELFRCYYGAPAATAANGTEVGAVRGLLASLTALLRDPAVTHVGIAFDTVIESFRNDLFAGYKTGAGIEPALWAQFPLAERAARRMPRPSAATAPCRRLRYSPRSSSLTMPATIP